jgi:replicative DNA helicase
MNKPTRIHRSRKKGARQPLDELGRKPVYVGRGRKSNPSKWGNPFKYVEGTKPKDKPAERARVVSLYEDWLRETPPGRAVAAAAKSELRGPQTGFEALDRHLGYALAPGLHAMHGNTGAGKTAFAWQLAAHCGFPALFVSCEMAPGELLRRHTARETKTYLGKFKSGEFSPEHARELARRAIEAAPFLRLLDATRAPAPPDHIRDCARETQGDAKGLLIVVDSVQSWAEGLAGGAGEYEALNEGVKSLRDLAHGLNAPILFVSERNRASMKEGGLNAGAGSRKIEYGAETVFDLERDMDAQGDGAGEVEITLRIAKNRHGAAGVALPLKFNGALQSFRELSTEEAVDRAKAKATKKERLS